MTATIEHPSGLTEPFWRFKGDWKTKSARTDTPDLMGLFSVSDHIGEDRLMAEGAMEFADEDQRLAEEDMAVGFETLPPE